ncbi:unnamed protein product, partial [Mesorhabditis spiculigera]
MSAAVPRQATIFDPFQDGNIVLEFETSDSLPMGTTFSDYCSRSVRSFLLGYIGEELAIWLDALQQINLTRPQLMLATHEKVLAIQRTVEELLTALCGDRPDITKKIRAHCLEWIFTGKALGVFSHCLGSMFAFSIVLFCQAALEGDRAIRDAADESLKVISDIKAFVGNYRKELSEEELRMGDPFFQPIISATFYAYFERIVKDNTQNTDCPPDFRKMEKAASIAGDWLSGIPIRTTPGLKDELSVFFETKYVDQFIEKIYDITINGDQNSAELIDVLSTFMQRNNGYGRDRIIKQLVTDVQANLLKINASTPLILTSYANAVTALRRLDPSGFIMQIVCGKIKDYLKQHRADTVRQIISFITKAGHRFNEQMERCVIIDDEDAANVNDEFLDEEDIRKNWRQWHPDPPDALLSKYRVKRSADVFTMLVSIYGSKDSFVKEYRQLLAERLTQAAYKDPGFESRYLSLLRLRFTEAELQQCEVMLKDISDSEKMMQFVLRQNELQFPLSVRAISTYFWPDMNKDKVTLFPDVIETQLTVFEKEFQKMKPDRRILWLRAAGCVELRLTLDGVEFEKVVTNATASVLYPFLEQETWTTGQLVDTLKVSRSAILKRLGFWQSQRILVHTGEDTWSLTTQTKDIDRLQYAEQDEEEDEDLEDPDSERADGGGPMEELEQYWNYTRTFIGSQEGKEMKAERLFGIYKMFGIQSLTLEQVVAFLKKKVRENLLTCNNGFYRVVTDPTAA